MIRAMANEKSIAALLLLTACSSQSAGPPAKTAYKEPAIAKKTEPTAVAEETQEPEEVAYPTDKVVEQIQNNLGKIRTCYERELKKDPSLAGRITFEFDIDQQGKVSRVNVLRENSDFGNQKAASCMQAVVRRLEFPQHAEADPITIQYPMMFESQ